MVTSLKSLRLEEVVPYLVTICFKISGVIGSFLCMFYSDHVNLNIEKSKTDIYREGKDVIISATNNYTCPVAMLSRYLLLANISEGSNDYIFRPLSLFHRPCFLKSLSSTPALAAAVAPPDRKLCRQYLDFSKPILLKVFP
jgi:hypothetical protein